MAVRTIYVNPGDLVKFDESYYPEGGYEVVENCAEWGFITVTEGEITNWMPFPEVGEPETGEEENKEEESEIAKYPECPKCGHRSYINPCTKCGYDVWE